MKRINFNVEDDLAKSIDERISALATNLSAYLRQLVLEDLQSQPRHTLKTSLQNAEGGKPRRLLQLEEMGMISSIETLFIARKILAHLADQQAVQDCHDHALDFLAEPLEKAARGQ